MSPFLVLSVIIHITIVSPDKMKVKETEEIRIVSLKSLNYESTVLTFFLRPFLFDKVLK